MNSYFSKQNMVWFRFQGEMPWEQNNPDSTKLNEQMDIEDEISFSICLGIESNTTKNRSE